eukprot:INCI15530.1.p1 GENE.INCI15530.1~~INCI15530.1.p1  ORF type:complete len:415 (-),score=76.12 INCI15530.1:424-1668(-)
MVYTCTVVEGQEGHGGPPLKLEAASFTNFRQTFFVAACLDASQQGRQVCLLNCTANFAAASAERHVFFVVAVHSDEGQDVPEAGEAAEPSAASIPSVASSSSTKTKLPKVYQHPIPSKLCASRLLDLEAAFPSVTRKKGLGSSFESESSSESSSDSDDSSDSEEVEKAAAKSSKKKASKSGRTANKDVLHGNGFHNRSLVLGQSSTEGDGGTSAASNAQWFPNFSTLTQHYQFTGSLKTELQTSSSSKVSYFVTPATSAEGVGDGPISSVAVSASLCYSTALRQDATELFVPSRTLRGKSSDNNANHTNASVSLCHIPVPLNQRTGPAANRPDESTIFSFGLPRANRVSNGPNSGKSAAEMLDNMRRRHASGSFMVRVAFLIPMCTCTIHGFQCAEGDGPRVEGVFRGMVTLYT